MQIKNINNKKIFSLSLISSILLVSGCSTHKTADIYVQNNTNEKVAFIEANKDNLNKLDFFEKADTRIYNQYSEKMMKNAKIRIVNIEPITAATPIPAMYINTDSFEELSGVLDEVAGIYSIVFEEDTRQYLTNTIKKESIIDMSKTNFTFEELMKKIAYKYDIYYERKNNTFTFKRFKDVKYHIPNNLSFEGKDTLAQHTNYTLPIIDTIKKFQTNTNKDAIIYDDITGNLYVKDTVSTIDRINQYIKDLKNVEDIHFNAEVVLIHYDSKRNSINWNVLNNNLAELNIKLNEQFDTNKEDLISKALGQNSVVIEDKYTFKKGNFVLDEVMEYLNEIGSAQIMEKVTLNSYNNKKMEYELSENNEFLESVGKDLNGTLKANTKTEKELFKVALIPAYDKENEKVNLNVDLNFRKLKDTKEIDVFDGQNFEKPIYLNKNLNSMYNIPQNSYLLVGIYKDIKGKADAFDEPKGFWSSLFSSDSVEEYLILVKLNTKKNLEHIKVK